MVSPHNRLESLQGYLSAQDVDARFMIWVNKRNRGKPGTDFNDLQSGLFHCRFESSFMVERVIYDIDDVSARLNDTRKLRDHLASKIRERADTQNRV